MMTLLSVTVKKARFVGIQAQQFNTYVTLKLQNVKSTTVTVKGATPCWEQDFLFEINNLDSGLLIEVWSKGMIWDRAIGYHWIPLQTIQYSNEDGIGQWKSLEAELVMRDGEVIGTKMPTGHALLVDSRFELPFDPENIEAMDLQRKLEMLNETMDQEGRVDNYRRMQYLGHSGYSEDSDYTSDLNYPVGPQHHHANSSASQFRSAAYQIATPTTPQRSLETSRENSSERADTPNAHHAQAPPGPAAGGNRSQHLSPDVYRRFYSQHTSNIEMGTNYKTTNRGQHSRQSQVTNMESEPLFYNSRPLNKSTYSSHENWMSCDSSAYNQSGDSFDAGLFMDANEMQQSSGKYSKARRPSLERQSTLYDDCSYYEYTTSIQNNTGFSSNHPLDQKSSLDEYYDVQPYAYQDERFGQDEEDRQWDSGGYDPYPAPPRTSKKLPPIPAIQQPLPLSDTYSVYEEPARPMSTGRRKMPQLPTKRSSWRQFAPEPSEGTRTPESYSHRGASLPPTPTKNSKMSSRLSQVLADRNGRAPTPGRQLPKPSSSYSSAKTKRNKLMKRTNSADYADNPSENEYMVRTGAASAMDNYNEDYNYAYQSNDNLPLDQEMTGIYSDQTNIPKDDYYSRTAQNREYNQSYYDVKVPVPSRKMDANFVQQNTDSLESRDDELKDSFETPVSSMSSSLQIIKPNAYPEPAGDLMSPNIAQKNILNAMSHHQEENPPLSSLTVAQVHNHNSLGGNKVFVKQQSCVDNGFYLPDQFGGEKNGQMEYGRLGPEDAYLENQESVESYVEEETEDSVAYGSNMGIGMAQAIKQDSPLSVIHVESREDDLQTLRSRESSQISVVLDPFHPTAQHQQQQQQQQQSPTVVTRKLSGSDVAHRNYNDNNLLYDDDDQFPTSYPRSKTDATPTRRPSVRRSPPTPEKIPEIAEVAPAAHEGTPEGGLPQPPVGQQAAAEAETSEHRPKITAQQRWLWAYNKIIMQMDVSYFQWF